jgi:hypothetical protein
MKKTTMVGLLLIVAGFAVDSRADIVANLLADPGFEAIIGNEPNAGTTPWFTTGENAAGSFISATDQAHSGLQSAKYTFYYDDGAIVQNLNAQVDTNQSYETSFWMLINAPSATAAHSNAPSINIGLYTSATLGGTYSFRQTLYGGALNSAEGIWEQFSAAVDGSSMTNYVDEYIQLRFNKSNANTTHRMYIDDTSFGIVIPEPATIGLLAMVGTGLFAARRFMLL